MKVVGVFCTFLFCISTFANFSLEDQLLDAVEKSDLKEVQRLLDEGANPNMNLGTPALVTVTTLSGMKNRIEIARALVEAGADVNIKDKPTESSWGYTPIMGCGNNGYTEVAAYLVSKGAEVNAVRKGVCPITALWLAAYTGKFETVKFLVEAGADTNFSGGCFYQKPLEIAREGNHLKIVKYLESL